MTYSVIWYRGVEENGYAEFRKKDFVSLVASIEYLTLEYGEDVVFDAIVNIQSEVAWVTDNLGFTIEKDGESWTRKI